MVTVQMFGQQYWFTDSRGRNHGVGQLENNHFVDPDIRPAFGDPTEWDLLEPNLFADVALLSVRRRSVPHETLKAAE